jgi:tetratricopeptide (TPR) repeat protein
MPKPLPLLIALAAIALGPAVADEPPATAEELIRAAETQLSQQDFDGAIATLTRALDADPESTLAHTRLGGAYLMTQRYDSAIEQFQQAIAGDADNAGAFIGMGMAYLHQGRAGPAKAALTEAKRLAPDKAAEIDDLITSIEQGTAGHP